jgi:hypothetical protein
MLSHSVHKSATQTLGRVRRGSPTRFEQLWLWGDLYCRDLSLDARGYSAIILGNKETGPYPGLIWRQGFRF